jgi:multiple sugar transport system permease protein
LSLPSISGRHGVSLLAAPATLLLIGMLVVPSLGALVLSFTNYEFGNAAWSFVGIANYAAMLRDPEFLISIRNTLVYVAIVVPLSVLLGLSVALLIETTAGLRAFYRVAYFLPVTATLVAMATVWEFMFHPSIGLINLTLASIGVAPMRFLGNPHQALYALATIGVWELVGFNMVLFLAGLSTIPQELYDAADVDGVSSAFDRFRTVTWPMLAPTTLFVVIITAVRAFRVFETVAVLTQGGPNKATDVLLYTIYREGFQYFKIGYASAMTMVFLFVTAFLMLMQMRYFDRRIHYT